MRLLVLPILVGACVSEAAFAPTPASTAGCAFDVTTLPTPGERGRVGFGYFPAASQKLDRPVAANGARTNILAFSSVDVAQAEDVRSSDPAVASFRMAAVAGGSCQHQYLVTVQSGRPGRTDLILVDAAGGEVDRVAVAVAPTKTLLYDRGWEGADPPLVLAGSLQGLHVTGVGDAGVLVGTGAVRFSLSGSLSRFPGEKEPPWWGGDEITFTGAPGRGLITADADEAHLEVSVEVVEESALTRLEVTAAPPSEPLTREVLVAAYAGDTPLYGAQCEWRWPLRKQPFWIDGGWIGAAPVTRYQFTVEKPGTYTALCVLPGGSNRAVELSFGGAPSHFR